MGSRCSRGPMPLFARRPLEALALGRGRMRPSSRSAGGRGRTRRRARGRAGAAPGPGRGSARERVGELPRPHVAASRVRVVERLRSCAGPLQDKFRHRSGDSARQRGVSRWTPLRKPMLALDSRDVGPRPACARACRAHVATSAVLFHPVVRPRHLPRGTLVTNAAARPVTPTRASRELFGLGLLRTCLTRPRAGADRAQAIG